MMSIENEYIQMKKNEGKVFNGVDHGKIVDNIMKVNFDKIKNFPYNSYDNIQEWQLKRISEIVDYAYENIPLYHKKYSKIGYRKGMIKTWKDFEKLPIIYKEELIEGFPNEIAKNIEDFNLSTRSSGTSGKFLTLSLTIDAIYIDTIQGVRQFLLQNSNNYFPEDVILFIYTVPWWIKNINGKYRQEFLPTTATVDEVIKKIEEVRPKIISTYPTYLTKMANHKINLKEYGVELVVVHSEQSTRQSRDMLEKALNVKVLDEYSSEELTRIALECPEHIYHLEEDACYIEIVDSKTKETFNSKETIFDVMDIYGMNKTMITQLDKDLNEEQLELIKYCYDNLDVNIENTILLAQERQIFWINSIIDQFSNEKDIRYLNRSNVKKIKNQEKDFEYVIELGKQNQLIENATIIYKNSSGTIYKLK